MQAEDKNTETVYDAVPTDQQLGAFVEQEANSLELTKAKIKELADDAKNYVIDGPDDKIGHGLLKEYRLNLKRQRLAITNKAEALAIMLTSPLLLAEKDLQDKEAAYQASVKAQIDARHLAQIKRTEARTNELKGYGYEWHPAEYYHRNWTKFNPETNDHDPFNHFILFSDIKHMSDDDFDVILQEAAHRYSVEQVKIQKEKALQEEQRKETRLKAEETTAALARMKDELAEALKKIADMTGSTPMSADTVINLPVISISTETVSAEELMTVPAVAPEKIPVGRNEGWLIRELPDEAVEKNEQFHVDMGVTMSEGNSYQDEVIDAATAQAEKAAADQDLQKWTTAKFEEHDAAADRERKAKELRLMTDSMKIYKYLNDLQKGVDLDLKQDETSSFMDDFHYDFTAFIKDQLEKLDQL